MNALFKKIVIPETGETIGSGWLPPLPDLRDFTEKQPEIEAMSKKLGISKTEKQIKAFPPAQDLRQWCSPIENQLNLGSCTAHAAVGNYP
jgi:C1A family cysteine protease